MPDLPPKRGISLRCFVLPGYPGGDKMASPTAADFVAQMTKPTNMEGVTNATSTPIFKFGPYLSAMPANPLTKLDSVQIVGDTEELPEATGQDCGWLYKPLTGEIVGNTLGNDAAGNAYRSY